MILHRSYVHIRITGEWIIGGSAIGAEVHLCVMQVRRIGIDNVPTDDVSNRRPQIMLCARVEGRPGLHVRRDFRFDVDVRGDIYRIHGWRVHDVREQSAAIARRVLRESRRTAPRVLQINTLLGVNRHVLTSGEPVRRVCDRLRRVIDRRREQLSPLLGDWRRPVQTAHPARYERSGKLKLQARRRLVRLDRRDGERIVVQGHFIRFLVIVHVPKRRHRRSGRDDDEVAAEHPRVVVEPESRPHHPVRVLHRERHQPLFTVRLVRSRVHDVLDRDSAR